MSEHLPFRYFSNWPEKNLLGADQGRFPGPGLFSPSGAPGTCILHWGSGDATWLPRRRVLSGTGTNRVPENRSPKSSPAAVGRLSPQGGAEAGLGRAVGGPASAAPSCYP